MTLPPLVTREHKTSQDDKHNVAQYMKHVLFLNLVEPLASQSSTLHNHIVIV